MKVRVLLTIILLGFFMHGFGQQNATWDKWNWLTGVWVGEGEGQPGKGGGTFSFTPDLGNKILVRKSHSEYPATDNKPAVIHEDLMVIYQDFSGNASKAIYFDNEGHTINYSVAYADKSIVLTSDKIEHVPIFRLTYSLLGTGAVNTKFEMSRDGENFMTYIEGVSIKAK
jgi:hypothetical protein